MAFPLTQPTTGSLCFSHKAQYDLTPCFPLGPVFPLAAPHNSTVIARRCFMFLDPAKPSPPQSLVAASVQGDPQ